MGRSGKRGAAIEHSGQKPKEDIIRSLLGSDQPNANFFSFLFCLASLICICVFKTACATFIGKALEKCSVSEKAYSCM